MQQGGEVLSIEDIRGCLRAIAERVQDPAHSQTPEYRLLRNEQIWDAVINGGVSLSQFQQVAKVAHDPDIFTAVCELSKHISIRAPRIILDFKLTA